MKLEKTRDLLHRYGWVYEGEPRGWQHKEYGDGHGVYSALQITAQRLEERLVESSAKVIELEGRVRRLEKAETQQIEEKNRAYFERNQLVAFLTKCYPSGVRPTEIEGWDPEWHGCVYVDTPEGQLSWHYHASTGDLFVRLPAYARPWDGHSTVEKYERLARLQPELRPYTLPGDTEAPPTEITGRLPDTE